MISETVEFVPEFFDEIFSSVATDRRVKSLKKVCTSLVNDRKSREGNGSVLVSAQIMNNLKYTAPALQAFLNRIESGEVEINDEDGLDKTFIYIASFGDGSKGSSSGWKGSCAQFIEMMMKHKVDESDTDTASKRFMLRDIPTSIVNHDTCEFFIFATVEPNKVTGYDRAIVSVIGMPIERIEEVHKAQMLRMFEFDK